MNFGGLCYKKKLILLSAYKFQGLILDLEQSEVAIVVSVPLKSWNLCQKAENSEFFAANWAIHRFSYFQNVRIFGKMWVMIIADYIQKYESDGKISKWWVVQKQLFYTVMTSV